ncbi:MAG: hypothetical protein WDN29_12310 [Methylovirgula sp.]
MNQILFVAFGTPVSVAILAMGLSGLAFVLLVLTLSLGANGRRRDAAEAVARQVDLQEKLADLARAHAEVTGRVRSMGEILGSRQADLARFVAEQLESVGSRVGRSLEDQSRNSNREPRQAQRASGGD